MHNSCTNIAKLLEYVLLPHNNEVTKPYALNTFLDELAELRIDEGLIKNKKFRSDFENTNEMCSCPLGIL